MNFLLAREIERLKKIIEIYPYSVYFYMCNLFHKIYR